MAEETVTQQKVPETKGAADKPQSEGRGGRRDRKAPEELYDLSQPIPREQKPDKEKHEAEIAAINDEIESLKEQRKTIQEKIEEAMDGKGNTAVSKEREALQQLRKKKGALIDEQKVLRARFGNLKAESDRLFTDRKAAKANIRYNDVKTIDEEIMKLKRRQETTSMSLTEEKRLIKEIESLQSSKSAVAELSSKDESIDDIKEKFKSVKAEIAAKEKEIDAVKAEIDKQNEAVKALGDQEGEARQKTKGMISERDEIKLKIGSKMDERSAIRQAFREASDKWFDYQRAIKAQRRLKQEEERKKREEEDEALRKKLELPEAIKAQRRLKQEEERKKREEEDEALRKKLEEEELKKIPYEEEMALCDFLVDYLNSTYLSDDKKEKKKKSDVVTVKDDPFAGFKPMKKKTDEVFLQIGKGKKKPRSRPSKKKPPTVFTLNVDSFEQFGLLDLTPPTSLDMVPGSVEELKAKKKWYSEQPRGSVPTAKEIRKASEKAAAKSRHSGSSNGKKGGSFNLSGDDFAPLSASGASVSAVNSTWGQKQAEDTAAVDSNEPTEA
eukprot:CAMPEP_0184871388 /NCGR_PEP_ID=MMETSP0580-20130426/40688_1 /TAXON_ID=1118495 /ORGANISM="Dactyliosolen fragilissimus" /LENGTH=554 /DNA_ID=CAMNT_0027374043 /DNA_START=87 /DNA_END=1753 /DNA_ORIENTATION=-